MNYYNDNDPSVCDWVRNLIKEGLVPDGEVDSRSIVDVQPEDVGGFVQCHWFCGILGWPEALRLAGVSPDRPLWTGSAPCQPFSSAGKQKGTADERHLWPEMFRLIRACRPPLVMGEQVAAKQALGWLDGVFDDLEGQDYTCWACDTCAPSVGAYHIRQRLYWLAHTEGAGGQPNARAIHGLQGKARCVEHLIATGSSEGGIGGLAHSQHQPTRGGIAGVEGCAGQRGDRPAIDGASMRMVNASSQGLPRHGGLEQVGDSEGRDDSQRHPSSEGLDGWSNVIFIPCRDGKYRPVPARAESPVCRVADGLPARVAEPCPDLWPLAPTPPGRAKALKGLGNAIVPQLASEFIRAYMESQSNA